MVIGSWTGPAVLIVFALAYALVFAEEKLHLRKSKPVMVAAGVIWILVALAFHREARDAEVGELLRRVLLDFAELLLFLLSALSFVNAMAERNIFDFLRTRIVALRLSVRGVFWIAGALSFVLSPIADNLTTGLVMGTVAISTLRNHRKATIATLVGVVTAANAGGAFSPFGDISTLMIWQKGELDFGQFFYLFIPSLISWLVPAFLISLTLRGMPSQSSEAPVAIRKGGGVLIALFLATIAGTVMLNHTLHLPPFLGMMTGFGLLNVYSYFLHRTESRMLEKHRDSMPTREECDSPRPFDIFRILEKTEWDTLLFFYGVMLCVGGVAALGYLQSLSGWLYNGLGNTTANILVGLISAIVDNIPLTFAVLEMKPQMGSWQWLLITFAAGTGGSILSIGSAAGVALMGAARGTYTFMSHLKWSWAILLGYGAGVAAHMLLNAGLPGR